MKPKIKKILVPLDGSPKSFEGLRKAIYLARHCGAPVTGICVLPLYTINLDKLLTPFKNQSLKETKKFMAQAKRLSAQNGMISEMATTLEGKRTLPLF